jgi:uncharacterized protein
MFRNLYLELKKWKDSKGRKPLIIRGARQVGKSYLVNEFGEKEFDRFVTINFELEEDFISHFDSPDPKQILNKIFLLKNEEVIPGKTLLFLDEIQLCPKAIISLRYFYEMLPDLHVIAAGSLLDFTLSDKKLSVPVGRVEYLYIYPMNFIEFLKATNNDSLAEYIENLSLRVDFDASIHKKLNSEFKNYLILGGMPAVINAYVRDSYSFSGPLKEKNTLMQTFLDDFKKYASRAEQKYLRLVFNTMHSQIGKKFIYSRVDPEQKSRDIKNAVELLTEACLINKVSHSSAFSKPLGALASDKIFKLIFLDCGLAQSLSGLRAEHIINEEFESSLAGALAEQFVGQELLASSDPYTKSHLYYWTKEGRSKSAEIDYLIEIEGKLVPIEVKAGEGGRMKSLKVFMNDHSLKLGVKVSMERLSLNNGVLNIPFYALSSILRIIFAF